jgi:hypothetical protein
MNNKHKLMLKVPLLAVCLLAAVCRAVPEEIDPIRAANLAKTADWFASLEAAAATNQNWTLLPRMLVDLEKKEIVFKAEATGLKPNEIVEFFLIGERSGNAYEATAVALAEPADIAKAIQMLGLPAGRHTDMSALRFWPEGERVHMYFNEHHAADLLLDKRTATTSARSGFVFTASHTTEQDGETVLSAQVSPPFSIAANYNEPRSILDVPFKAPQSAVYSEQVQNPDIRFEPGQLLTVRIVPERVDGSRRMQRSKLTATHAGLAHPLPAANLRFTLHGIDDGTTHLENAPLDVFFAFIRNAVQTNRDPFLEAHFGPDLPVSHARALAQIIDSMEKKDGLRVLPPPEGSLFFLAFSPHEENRHRDNRIGHPWELHLSHTDAPVLVQITEEWIQGEIRPDISIENITITDPAGLGERMEELRPGVKAVFIYAPQDMRVGQIMELARHFQKTHPLIHVFMEPSPRDRTSDATPVATSE